MIYFAFDPGERWTGFARLARTGARTWRADAGVLDGTPYHRAAQLLDLQLLDLQLGDGSEETVVVAEDYHVRPVGHQRFTSGIPLRLLGALEYVSSGRAQFFLEPSAPADEGLELLGISHLLSDLRGDPRWEHARSAWRVLGMHLLREAPELVRSLDTPRSRKGRTEAPGGARESPRPSHSCPLPGPVLSPHASDLWAAKRLWLERRET